MGAACGDPGGGENPMMKFNLLQFMKLPYVLFIQDFCTWEVVSNKVQTKMKKTDLMSEAMGITLFFLVFALADNSVR